VGSKNANLDTFLLPTKFLNKEEIMKVKCCMMIDTDKLDSSKIETFLTRTFQGYQNEENTIACFFEKERNILRVPRYFPISRFLPDYQIEYDQEPGEKIDIESKIILRNQVQKDTVEYMMKNERGIIQLSPGSGKTVISIEVICRRKKKTLILVHRKSLVEQWKERLLEFTSLNEYEIETFKTSNIDDSFEKPIIIATVQSLMSCLGRNYKIAKKKLENSKIGISILDEAHTTSGAQKFSRVSLYLPSKVNFGLSATPFRKDTGDIMEFHLGNVIKPGGNSGTMKAFVKVLLFDFGIIKKKGLKNRYFYWKGRFQRSRYLTQMKKSDIFFHLSKLLIEKYIKNRNILFVNERIKIIETLFDEINFQDKAKFIQQATNESLNHTLVFATPGKVRDGVDAPQKDMLIISSPISNIEQLSGRIVRSYPEKKNPIVFDFVDIGCKDIFNTLKRRLKFYNEKKWDIEFFKINQNLTLKKVDNPFE